MLARNATRTERESICSDSHTRDGRVPHLQQGGPQGKSINMVQDMVCIEGWARETNRRGEPMDGTVRLRVSPEARLVIEGIIDALTERFREDINRNRQYKRATSSDAIIWLYHCANDGPREANRAYLSRLKGGLEE